MSLQATQTAHLLDRLAAAKNRLTPVQSKYRVVFEDPANPDAPAAVLVPDPNWMASALNGGILPPIKAYHAAKFRVLMEMEDGEQVQGIVSGDKCADMLHELHQRGGKMLGQCVVDYPPAYAEPIGPMTEEQSIEYLIKKDIPPRVWRDYRGNRRIMAIVPVEAVPRDRTHRNAWEIIA